MVAIFPHYMNVGFGKQTFTEFWHVCLEQNNRHAFMFFDDAVRKAFRLFANVPEIKEKQKKCLNLLLKRKDVLGLLPARLGKSLIY